MHTIKFDYLTLEYSTYTYFAQDPISQIGNLCVK